MERPGSFMVMAEVQRVYVGGLSRGTTPPREIPTTGAAGHRNLKEQSTLCPFAKDETLPFLQRFQGLSLNVLTKEDVPPGPLKFPKDQDLSLTTQDIELCQPSLAHPSNSNIKPVPWRLLDKPQLPDPERSTSRPHYPPVPANRPRDLSLTVSDIHLAQAQKLEPHQVRRLRADCIVDLLTPSYQLPSYDGPLPPQVRSSGRNTLDISDIEGAAPGPVVPVRTRYGDTMRCEQEFRSKGRERAISEATRGHQVPAAQPRTVEERKPMCRETNPLEPRYTFRLTADSPGTSLYCRHAEERSTAGAAPPLLVTSEIGFVEGSVPRLGKSKAENFSLETADLEGARPMLRVGCIPYSMYGPAGNRPAQSTNLTTSDIVGAQASTLPHGPRLPRARLTGASIVGTPRQLASRPQEGLEVTLRPD